MYCTLLQGTQLYFTPLYSHYYTVHYCTLLYCTLLYSNVLYNTVQHTTVLYTTERSASVLYTTVLYSTVQYTSVLYITLLYITLLYITLLYITLLGTGVWTLRRRAPGSRPGGAPCLLTPLYGQEAAGGRRRRQEKEAGGRGRRQEGLCTGCPAPAFFWRIQTGEKAGWGGGEISPGISGEDLADPQPSPLLPLPHQIQKSDRCKVPHCTTTTMMGNLN